MHPLEYLRSVARHTRADGVHVAQEFAGLVGGWGLSGPELIVAARRLLDRRPDAVELWWAASVIVAARDERSAARCVEEVLDEPHAWPDTQNRVVLVDAASPQRCLVSGRSLDVVAEAEQLELPVSLVVGQGCEVPDEYIDRIREAIEARGERVGEIDRSKFEVTSGSERCPFAPELLRRSAM